MGSKPAAESWLVSRWKVSGVLWIHYGGYRIKLLPVSIHACVCVGVWVCVCMCVYICTSIIISYCQIMQIYFEKIPFIANILTIFSSNGNMVT